jgi:hypothetical protein
LIRLIAPLLVLLLGVASGIGLVACGDDSGDAKLLPAASAEEINANLDDVEDLLAECELVAADDAAEDVRRQIEKVADQIDPELRDNLLEGAAMLEQEIADDDCQAETTEATTETTESDPTTETTTTEKPTTEETTTEDEPTEEEPTEEDEPTGEEPTTEQPEPPPSETPPSAPPSGGVGPGQSAIETG